MKRYGTDYQLYTMLVTFLPHSLLLFPLLILPSLAQPICLHMNNVNQS